MNKAQFRWLLVAYVVFVAIGIVPELYRHLVIPEAVLRLEPAYVAESMSFKVVQSIYVPLFMVAGIVGIIGMFCLWRPGRYFFLLGVAMKTFALLLFVPWAVVTGLSGFFANIELLLDGTILTLSLFGPAKHLFSGGKSRKSL